MEGIASSSLSPAHGRRRRTSRPRARAPTTPKTPTTSRWARMRSTWATAGAPTFWARAHISGSHLTGLAVRLNLSRRMYGPWTMLRVRRHRCLAQCSIANPTDILLGTWSVASGTSYEAEDGTRNGSSTILSDSSFSGGEAVGYLGTFLLCEI